MSSSETAQRVLELEKRVDELTLVVDTMISKKRKSKKRIVDAISKDDDVEKKEERVIEKKRKLNPEK